MAPLHAAAQMGCLSCIKWIVDDQGIDINLRDGDKATPLHFAASRGHIKAVRWLLKRGAKLLMDKHGKMPYHDAGSLNNFSFLTANFGSCGSRNSFVVVSAKFSLFNFSLDR